MKFDSRRRCQRDPSAGASAGDPFRSVLVLVGMVAILAGCAATGAGAPASDASARVTEATDATGVNDDGNDDGSDDTVIIGTGDRSSSSDAVPADVGQAAGTVGDEWADEASDVTSGPADPTESGTTDDTVGSGTDGDDDGSTSGSVPSSAPSPSPSGGPADGPTGDPDSTSTGAEPPATDDPDSGPGTTTTPTTGTPAAEPPTSPPQAAPSTTVVPIPVIDAPTPTFIPGGTDERDVDPESSTRRNGSGVVWTLDDAGERACVAAEGSITAIEVGDDAGASINTILSESAASSVTGLAEAAQRLSISLDLADIVAVLHVCAQNGYDV